MSKKEELKKRVDAFKKSIEANDSPVLKQMREALDRVDKIRREGVENSKANEDGVQRD